MDIDSNSGAVWEFYSPFAHIPGKYEWCRIHSPTHGSFDTFIVLAESTDRPPWVYVNSENGERFMAERYPESAVYKLRPQDLTIEASPDACTVEGRLSSAAGPAADVRMRLSADVRDIPHALPYGGESFAVWGSRWSCTGVDLVRSGHCDGHIEIRNEERYILRSVPCIVCAGSFGRINPLLPL